jgi:hypothetical protein
MSSDNKTGVFPVFPVVRAGRRSCHDYASQRSGKKAESVSQSSQKLPFSP